MKRRYLPILLTLLYSSLLPADSITTLQLRNRPAEAIIPVIEPLLEPGDKISGQGFKIFLRAAPQTVAEIEALIESIDVAAKSLLISVFQGRERDLEQRDISASIRVYNGNISGSISAGETRRSESGGPLQRLRVTEGNEGFIAMGTRSGLFSTHEVNAASGFYVLPRVNGERITLQISPFSSQLRGSGGSIETLQASTTISGQLGEWLPLGGVEEHSVGGGGDGIGQRSSRRNQQDRIWIRADLVR